MANFKGGFAFNNEAAKVEVEQAPDGTLISCINPVTGESLAGGDNHSEQFEGTAAALFTNTDIGMDVEEFVEAIRDHNASIRVSYDLSAMGLLEPVVMEGYYDRNLGSVMVSTIQVYNGNADGFFGEYAGNHPDVLPVSALYQISGGTAVEMTASAAAIPAITTVYFHPMPE